VEVFIIGSLVVLGVRFSPFFFSHTNAVMSSVDKKSYGVPRGPWNDASDRDDVQHGIGHDPLFDDHRTGSDHAEILSSFLKCIKITFVISAILCSGGVFASLARADAAENRIQ